MDGYLGIFHQMLLRRRQAAAILRRRERAAAIVEQQPVTLDVEPRAGPASIIVVSEDFGREIIKKFKRNPEELRTLGRRDFEKLVAEIWDGFGYDVELTRPTRDGGRDVIAIREREANVRYLIECKRPDPGNKIGVRPVRELLGVHTHEGSSKAILATTACFTKGAKLLFEQHRWELEGRDFDGLCDWLALYLDLNP